MRLLYVVLGLAVSFPLMLQNYYDTGTVAWVHVALKTTESFTGPNIA